MDPSFPPAYASLIYNLVRAGRFQDLPPVMEAYVKVCDELEAKGMRAYILAHEGKKDEARKLADELSAEPTRRLSPYSLAVIYFVVGEDEKGFEMLERAYRDRDRYLGFMWIEDDLVRVRGDLRFQSLLEKVGLAGRIRT